MMNRLLALAPVSALLLAACATPSSEPAAGLAAVDALLASAEVVAAAYESLPPCHGQGGLCSNPRLVAKIVVADQEARAVLAAVHAGQKPLQDAINAIATFANLVGAPDKG